MCKKAKFRIVFIALSFILFIARAGMHKAELPYPLKNLTEKYIQDVLLPQLG